MNPLPFDLEGGRCIFPGWALVTVHGRDRERFLQSQLTADVAGLKVRESCLSALLDRSARVKAICFALRDPDYFRLLVPDHLLDTLLGSLREHLVADDVELVTEKTDVMTLALGPGAAESIRLFDPSTVFPLEIYAQSGFVTWSKEPVDLPELSAETIRSRRLLSGFPSWDLDVASGQLVNETVLVDTAVAHDKGCYLGQETVHKVHSRRGAAFAPMLLEVHTETADPTFHVGRSFAVGSGNGGVILDWATWNDRLFFEASLHRDHRVAGRTLSCIFDCDTSLNVSVHRLPFLRPPNPRDTAERLLEHAAKLFTRNHESRAERLLERAIAVCPDYPDSYEALGVALGRRGETEQAISLMHRLLDVDPESVMAHANLSVYYKNLGRIADAERELELAHRGQQKSTTPSDPSAEPLNEAPMESEQEISHRESMFKQVLAIDPDDVLALFSLGELRLAGKRYRDAVDYLVRVVEIQPSHAEAHLRLGEAWERLGDPGAAASVYEAGVRAAAAAGNHDAADAMQSRLNEFHGADGERRF